MTASVWSVVAVDAATGASPHPVPGAAIRPLTRPLNDAATIQIDLRTVDPDLAEFLDPAREIQVWQNGTIRFWGPVVRIEIDGDLCQFQCADPWWYLGRRFFGKADRTNLLANGDFEDGPTDWTGSGLIPVVDPFRTVQGQKSVRLKGASAGHDTYLHQTYTHSQSHPLGDDLTIAGWVWVSSEDYGGDATGSLGLFAERRSSGGTLLDVAGDAGDDQPALIDASTPKDQWVRLETSLIGVKDGDTVQVRLYPPFGSAWWDLVTFTGMESLSFLEQDLATIIRGVVLYAQDRYPGFTHGKSDLNLDVDVAPTGITLWRTWQFADHQNISDELTVFTRRRDGVDFAVEVGATTRTLVVSHPHRGVTRDDITLEYGVNMTKFRWSHDRTQKADTSVVLGPGDGPDREEGSASATPDGPTLEDVTVAADGTAVGELDRAASERLATILHPEVLQVTCTPDVYDILDLGDWVPVVIAPIAVTDTYRAITIGVDPANDATLITLNRRDPETPEEAMARFPRAVDACLAPGGGVWVVGSDGGVGSFGDAVFHGSIPGDEVVLNAPVVAIVPHGAGGYWLVAADAGCFNYGDAPARPGITVMVETEYPRGDRAIVAAEPYDPDGDDTLIMIADDGATYIP